MVLAYISISKVTDSSQANDSELKMNTKILKLIGEIDICIISANNVLNKLLA